MPFKISFLDSLSTHLISGSSVDFDKFGSEGTK
jgi:hypothetical protein